MKTKRKLQLKKLKIAQLDNAIEIKGGGTQDSCDVSVNVTLCPANSCDYYTCDSQTVETRTSESLGNSFSQ